MQVSATLSVMTSFQGKSQAPAGPLNKVNILHFKSHAKQISTVGYQQSDVQVCVLIIQKWLISFYLQVCKNYLDFPTPLSPIMRIFNVVSTASMSVWFQAISESIVTLPCTNLFRYQYASHFSQPVIHKSVVIPETPKIFIAVLQPRYKYQCVLR